VLARFGKLTELDFTCAGITPHGVQAASDGEQVSNRLSWKLFGVPGHTFRASCEGAEGQADRVTVGIPTVDPLPCIRPVDGVVDLGRH